MQQTIEIIKLLIVLQISHYIGDFVFRFQILPEDILVRQKKVKPIYRNFLHAILHSSILILFIWAFTDISYYWLSLIFYFNTITHFIIDYIKYLIDRLSLDFFNLNKNAFWNLLGFDQTLHQLVYIFIIYMIYV